MEISIEVCSMGFGVLVSWYCLICFLINMTVPPLVCLILSFLYIQQLGILKFWQFFGRVSPLSIMSISSLDTNSFSLNFLTISPIGGPIGDSECFTLRFLSVIH